MSSTVVFEARKVITGDPMQPLATHIAVQEGRVLAVGTAEEMTGWGDFAIDRTFAGDVIMAGLVEGHAHAAEGGLWRWPYVGQVARKDPDGGDHAPLLKVADVVGLLHVAEQELRDAAAPLVAWGIDPLLLDDGDGLTADSLDRVSATRPVVILHDSGHALYVNHAALTAVGYDETTAVEGVLKDAAGKLTGGLLEFAAMMPVAIKIMPEFAAVGRSAADLRGFAEVAHLRGVTTVADMGTSWWDVKLADVGLDATADPAFPARLVAVGSVVGVPGMDPDAAVAQWCETRKRSTDKLFLTALKIFADGSIQQRTGRLNWPHYYGMTDHNGIWNQSPDDLARWTLACHKAGVQVNCHANGDEASDAFINAVGAAMAGATFPDHRHTMQHAQMLTEAQLLKMRALGMAANIFSNHIYYWGDLHRDVLLGPERASRMDPCASADRIGVPYGFHCDDPVSPIDPLFTAWCAVNRLTRSGRVLGADERIPVARALHAATLGAAYILKLDHLIGSIQAGKFADFTVLGEDPLSVAPVDLKDVPRVATVVGGRVFSI